MATAEMKLSLTFALLIFTNFVSAGSQSVRLLEIFFNLFQALLSVFKPEFPANILATCQSELASAVSYLFHNCVNNKMLES